MSKRGPRKNDRYKGVWNGGVRNKTEGGGGREKLVLSYDVIIRFNKKTAGYNKRSFTSIGNSVSCCYRIVNLVHLV